MAVTVASSPTRRTTVTVPVALGLGLAAGAATSLLQTHADQPWLGLVNSASPWLTTAFVAGVLQPRWRPAVLAGLAATVLQVVGYYGTASLRGFGVSSSFVVLWTACAVLGGPLLGWAGHVWRTGRPHAWAPAAATVLAASWVAEGLVSYGWRLGYTSTAALFVVVGLVLGAALGSRTRRWSAQAAWAAVLVLAGGLGYVALDVVA